MTFEEWKTTRYDSIKFAQKTIESMKESIEDSELSKLFGTAYNDTITDEIREYNKSIMMTLIETDLYQIAAALDKIAGTMPKAPETTSRTTWKKEGDFFKCGNCGELSCCEGKFCPECGAKMYVEVDKVVDDLMKELAHDDE